MEKPLLKISVRVALLIMALRLVLHLGSLDTSWSESFYWFCNLAALPAMSIYALWPRRKGATLSQGFLVDARESIKMLCLYSLLMTLFFFVYYGYIDSDFFPTMHEKIVQQELEQAEADVDAATLRQRVEGFFSLRNGTAVLLALYIALSAFYSILFAALRRAAAKVRQDR